MNSLSPLCDSCFSHYPPLGSVSWHLVEVVISCDILVSWSPSLKLCRERAGQRRRSVARAAAQGVSWSQGHVMAGELPRTVCSQAPDRRSGTTPLRGRPSQAEQGHSTSREGSG